MRLWQADKDRTKRSDRNMRLLAWRGRLAGTWTARWVTHIFVQNEAFAERFHPCRGERRVVVTLVSFHGDSFQKVLKRLENGQHDKSDESNGRL
eukprot:COSAG02_NODE_10214_length_1994_cov_1.731926_1_plen_93_part_10